MTSTIACVRCNMGPALDGALYCAVCTAGSSDRDEVARLREQLKSDEEVERSQYETICAVADALGLKTWGNEELAPAVQRQRSAAKDVLAALRNHPHWQPGMVPHLIGLLQDALGGEE